jgi:hypothetical protein
MKKLLYTSACLLLVFSCSKKIDEVAELQLHSSENAKVAVQQFSKLYGGSSDEEINDIIKSNSQGYIFTAVSFTADPFGNVWVVKTSETGNVVWEKNYGGNSFERANSIIKIEGGYLLVGVTYSTDGDVTDINGGGDAFVMKINETGSVVNKKSFGGNENEEFQKIIVDDEGNYVIAGSTNSSNGDVTGQHGFGDVWVVKLDKNLDIVWQKTLGGTQGDVGNSVALSHDGGYVISGFTSSADGDVKVLKGGADFWLVKLTKQGNIVWEKTYGGTGFELPSSLCVTVDKGFLIAGLTTSNDGDVTERKGGFVDAWLVKTDKDGNLKWNKAIGGSEFEQSLFAITAHNGDLLVGGNTTSNDVDFSGNKGTQDGWLMRLDKQGHEKWTKLAGGSDWDLFRAATPGNQGNYVFAGYSWSNDGDVSGNHGFNDGWVLKLEDK